MSAENSMETLHRELMVIANKAHWQELEVGVKVLLLEESLLESALPAENNDKGIRIIRHKSCWN